MSSREKKQGDTTANYSPRDIARDGWSSGTVIGTSMVQRLSQQNRLSSTYQGVRHLVPSNLSRLRQLIKQGSGRKQIDSLRAAGRVSSVLVESPLIRNPNKR